jgi:hypothetical protein
MRIRIAATFLLLTLAPTTATADDETADTLIEKGLVRMGKGDYDGALRVFLEAKFKSATPRVDAQIAIAEQALGRYIDAEVHLAEVLQAKDDPWVKKNHAALEQSLVAVRSELGSLIVGGKPKDARVSLDGQQVGTVPMNRPIRLRKGPLWVDVTKLGYVGKNQNVQIVPGKLTAIEVDLREIPNPESAKPPPPPKPPLIPPDPDHTTRTDAWTCAGIGALMIAGGSYFWVSRQGQQGPTGDALGKGLVAGGAAAVTCGVVIALGNQPSPTGTKVSSAGSLLLAVKGRF